jgi:glycosyltransferase involved in cell wall biosynthesis
MISVVIPIYNMAHLIEETIKSVRNQSFTDVEIIVYDDCSTDNIKEIDFEKIGAKYFRGKENVGVGEGFNKGIEIAKGEYVVLLCSDDILVEKYFFEDLVNQFEKNKNLGHISRFYYQFIDGDKEKSPVRAWRDRDILILSNNPSGLAYRKAALEGCKASSKMFVELTQLTKQVLDKGWESKILEYDAVAVRVHDSTSTRPEYWLKRRVSSPVLDWVSLGAKNIARDYVSLIQIKNGFTISAVLEEIRNFIKVRPANAYNLSFWFFAIVAIVTPRRILRMIPKIYRAHIGKRITKRIRRNE